MNVNGATALIPSDMNRAALMPLYSEELNFGVINRIKLPMFETVDIIINMFRIQKTFSQAKT
jgi:hypothetical protein